MIKKTKFILPILLAFTLSGCSVIKNIINGGGRKKDSSSSEDIPSEVTPSHEEDHTSEEFPDWPDSIKAEMMEYLGFVLPYAPLNEDTMYSDCLTDEGWTLYYIGDDNENDVFNGYDQKVINEGFVEYNDDEFGDFFYKEIGDVEVYLTFAWYEATDQYNAGNEINVELYYPVDEYDSEEDYDSEPTSEEGEDSSKEEEDPSEQEPENSSEEMEDSSEEFEDSSKEGEESSEGEEESSEEFDPADSLWPDSADEDMMYFIGEVLPYAPFNESTLYSEYDDSYYDDYGCIIYYLGDDNETDVLTADYADKLIAAGYTEDLDDDSEICYVKEINGNTVVVYFAWFEAFEGDDENDPYEAGNQITVYIYYAGGSGSGEVPEGSKIDFSDSSTYAEVHDDDFGMIQCGQYTISVDKGTSSIAVCNNQWPDSSNAFRFYAGQIITIEWEEEAPNKIVLEASGSSYALKASNCTIEGANLSQDSYLTTLTVTGDSVVITLTAQIRILSIEFQ